MYMLLLCFLFVNHPHLIINCANEHAFYNYDAVLLNILMFPCLSLLYLLNSTVVYTHYYITSNDNHIKE